jgi:hypothetical protein
MVVVVPMALPRPDAVESDAGVVLTVAWSPGLSLRASVELLHDALAYGEFGPQTHRARKASEQACHAPCIQGQLLLVADSAHDLSRLSNLARTVRMMPGGVLDRGYRRNEEPRRTGRHGSLHVRSVRSGQD